jgi:Ca2+-binding RTX toxin-like protein
MRYISDFRAIVASIDNQSLRWNSFLPKGTPVVVTYSFADGANVPGISESAYSVTGTSAMNTQQRQNFREAINIFEAAAGITFVEIDEGGMIDASSASGSNYGGWAEVAWATKNQTGTGVLVIDQNNNYNQGSYGFFVALHEIGHALGLEHPFEGALRLRSSADNQNNTVMTYNATAPYAVDLGRFDQQALQDLYGKHTDVSDWNISYNNARKVMNITAGNADDTVLGVAGKNRLKGGSGDDMLVGREDNDFLRGQAGNDRLVGMAGKDTLYGDTGADVLYGDIDTKGRVAGAADVLYGGYGDDTLYGGAARDLLRGNSGHDHLLGGQGLDTLFGGYGNDTLEGGNGRDTLSGQQGRDVLIGGAKADVFVFDTKAYHDRILDFENGADRLSLVGFTFDDLHFVGRANNEDTLITVDGLNVRIYLENVTVAELDSSDFI